MTQGKVLPGGHTFAPREGNRDVEIRTSVVVTAIGALLTYVVDARVAGLNLQTVGLILMCIGTAGVVLSLAFRNERSFKRREAPIRQGGPIRL